MFTDLIPSSTPFSSHTQADGSDIGGVPPTKYGITLLPSKKPSWLMGTEGNTSPGSQWPAVMFYPAESTVTNSQAVPRPILPNTGSLQLAFDLWLSSSALTSGNVVETDTILVINGFKYNLSGQRHLATGQIDVGNWTDTGLRLGVLAPNVKHKIVWSYEFNTVAKTSSVLSYECDGLVSPITVLQNMPATDCEWAEGATPQCQLGSLEAGSPWSIVVGNIKYHWS